MLLLRKANTYIYNNYYYNVDVNGNNTRTCQDIRKNVFFYSEYNYLENNKETQKISNGTIKSFNDTVVDYRDATTTTIVTERNAMVSVSNSCNSGIYDNFDTNSSVFFMIQ